MFDKFADIVNVDDVCKMLRISKNTVYMLIRSGELPAKRIGRIYRIRSYCSQVGLKQRNRWYRLIAVETIDCLYPNIWDTLSNKFMSSFCRIITSMLMH